jgi:hypothetical protein
MTSVAAAEDGARGLDELAERIAPLFAGPLFAGLRHAIAPQLPLAKAPPAAGMAQLLETTYAN